MSIAEFKFFDSINVSDSLNDLNASKSNAGLTTGNWGEHSNNLSINANNFSFAKALIFSSLVVLGFVLYKKMRK